MSISRRHSSTPMSIGITSVPSTRVTTPAPERLATAGRRTISIQERGNRCRLDVSQPQIRHLLRGRVLQFLNDEVTRQMTSAELRPDGDHLIIRTVGQIDIRMARVAPLGNEEHLAAVP